MTKYKSYQAGFGTIAVIAVVVVVLTVIGAGVGVYKRQNSAASKSDTSSNNLSETASPADEPQPPTTNEYTVSELGVKFTVPDSLNDMTYAIKDIELSNGTKIKAAYFSTESLTRISSKCSAESGGIAAMNREDGQYPKNEENLVMDYGPLLKQFPNDFVTYITSKADCTDSTDAEELRLRSETSEALTAAVKTIKLTN